MSSYPLKSMYRRPSAVLGFGAFGQSWGAAPRCKPRTRPAESAAATTTTVTPTDACACGDLTSDPSTPPFDPPAAVEAADPDATEFDAFFAAPSAMC
jgi:hypothetical protein